MTPPRILLRRDGLLVTAAFPPLVDRAARDALLRATAATFRKIDAASVGVGRDKAGAPVALGPAGGCFLSVASRDGAVVAGAAETPVGVDVEAIGAPQAPPWTVLHPAEAVRLAAIADAGARHEAFLRNWTAKEAWLKALRVGLSREPGTLDVNPLPDGAIAIADAWRAREGRAEIGAIDEGGRRWIWAAALP